MFVSGLEEPVVQALRDSVGGVEVRETQPGMVLWASPAPPGKIKGLRFFRNTFLLLRRREVAAETPPTAVLLALAEDGELLEALRRYGAALRGTFRLMVQHEARLVAVEPAALAAMEQVVAAATGLRPSRAQADHELWLHLRTGGAALFALRVTRHRDYEKVLERGELRPELADVLCRLSEPGAGELFLDPFAGAGAIALERAAGFPRGLVLANDLDAARVESLQQKVARVGLKKRVVVRRVDALAMDRYESGCIDKIVTDPPWGQYTALDREPGEFYRQMFAECQRVLKPGGILVVLMARDEVFEALSGDLAGLEQRARYSILMSGRKAVVYKWVKV
jgi:16S rRNA G966 N2-methylase RsmD